MFRSKPTTLVNRSRKLIATALVLAFQSGAVLAGPTVRVDIPAQPLSAGLRALASQTGIQLLFTPETVGAAKGVAIKGEMSVEDALRQLLVGSGLEFSQDGERNYVVVRPAQAEHGLAETVVTATRTERSIDDVPASVSVITAKDISRLQPNKIEDVLKNVQGIDINSDPALGQAGNVYIRGVGGSSAGATSQVMVDGLPTDSPISNIAGRGGLNFVSAQDIERIEVLRGPASALYGPGVVGGVVNVIPKRWSGPAGAEVNVGVGSHDARSLGAAAGMANNAFDIRLSAYDFRTDGYIAQPQVVWGENDLKSRDWKDSKFSLLTNTRPSDHQEITLGFHTYRIDTAELGGHPNQRTKSSGDATTLGYRHEFGSVATLKAIYRKSAVKMDSTDDNADLSLASKYWRYSYSDSLDGQVDLHLTAGNQLTLGASYVTGKQEAVYSYGDKEITHVVTTGLFVQDEHQFGDSWTAIVGGRYDHFSFSGDTLNGAPVYPDASDSVFNPRLGLIYRLDKATSLYWSAGTAYVPATKVLKYNGGWAGMIDNPTLKPEKSLSYEFGIKHNPSWGSLGAALFHTDYQDKIEAVNVGAQFQNQNVAKVVINGLELSAEGGSGAWKSYANFAYTRSIIKQNPAAPETEGKRLQRVAPVKLNFGLAYGTGDGWEARVGGRYVSEVFFANDNNPVNQAGGYFVADAKVSAELPQVGGLGALEAYLAVNNLFDRKYFQYNEYTYADGRTVWLGVSGKF